MGLGARERREEAGETAGKTAGGLRLSSAPSVASIGMFRQSKELNSFSTQGHLKSGTVDYCRLTH